MSGGNDFAREPLSLILDRLDTIADLLRFQMGLKPERLIVENIQSPVQIDQDRNMLLELFLAASLPSSPGTVEEFTVTNVEVQLAINQSIPLQRVSITNDNVAQPLWVTGKKGVLVTTGRLILPQETEDFVIPDGHSLWGICAIPNISVRVSTGYDFYRMLASMRAERGG